MRCSVCLLLNFRQDSVCCNGTLAVIVAKIHKFFTNVFTASTKNSCHRVN